MAKPPPFEVKDCALIVSMGGVPDAMNLRELRERVATAPVECLYHHFCETPLRPAFDDPEFRNDFAVWASRDLHDRPLAERLGVLDPYAHMDMDDLRQTVIDIIEDRLSELEMVPWVQSGYEFHFMKAVTVVFETGRTIKKPSDLPGTIEAMTPSSLYYHFIEARRRTEEGRDDFTQWLADWNDETAALREALEGVDFYFLTLLELKKTLMKAMRRASEVNR
jgi:hypothetical protein